MRNLTRAAVGALITILTLTGFTAVASATDVTQGFAQCDPWYCVSTVGFTVQKVDSLYGYPVPVGILTEGTTTIAGPNVEVARITVKAVGDPNWYTYDEYGWSTGHQISVGGPLGEAVETACAQVRWYNPDTFAVTWGPYACV